MPSCVGAPAAGLESRRAFVRELTGDFSGAERAVRAPFMYLAARLSRRFAGTAVATAGAYIVYRMSERLKFCTFIVLRYTEVMQHARRSFRHGGLGSISLHRESSD
jgi:hypothetical protein